MDTTATRSSRAAAWPTIDEVREAARSGTGEGVRVAVIDSGIEATHPRLSQLRLRDSVGFEEERGCIRVLEGEGHDIYGHGTAVAATATRRSKRREAARKTNSPALIANSAQRGTMTAFSGAKTAPGRTA